MNTELTFDPIRLPPECARLRAEVRAFLAEEIEAGTFSPFGGAIDGNYSEDFSRKLGARGWIGMTWPKQYGGHERSYLERYVVTEELRVANAPVRLHFVADRQLGGVFVLHASTQRGHDAGAIFALDVPRSPRAVQHDAARHSLSSRMTSHHRRGGAGALVRMRSSRIAFTSSSAIAPNASFAPAADSA